MNEAPNISELSPASQALIALQGDQPAPDSDWFAGLRAEALGRFGRAGLPTPKLEDWKYTDLKALNAATLVLPGGGVAGDFAATGNRLCFLDGRFTEGASNKEQLPDGVIFLSLGQALADMPDLVQGHLYLENNRALSDLNGACLEDGAVIVADGADVTLALEFLASDGGSDLPAFHPRNIVIAKGGARVTLLEVHRGDGACFANHVTTLTIEAGARLNHIKVFADAAGAFNTSLTDVQVAEDGYYGSAILATGGRLLRNEIHIRLAGEGAETSLAGVYLVRRDQHTDHTTRIDHLSGNTKSRQVFRGALDGKARAVFQGNIVVAEGADGSDGRLANDTIMLAGGCEIDSKPQLEIYADDVKCAHGSTVGELDEEALFYLRSRGVPEPEARAMLVEGFVATVFDQFKGAEGIEVLRAGIVDWLAGLERET